MSFEKSDLGYRNFSCDKCSISIKAVFADDNGFSLCLQPLDALVLKLTGGYGEFVDILGGTENEITYILCKNCAIVLCDSNPALKDKVIKFVGVGHFCFKIGKHSWEDIDHCAKYCSQCRNEAGYMKKGNDRPISQCDKCSHEGPVLFAWEGITHWYVEYNVPQSNCVVKSGPFLARKSAEKLLSVIKTQYESYGLSSKLWKTHEEFKNEMKSHMNEMKDNPRWKGFFHQPPLSPKDYRILK